MNRTVLKVISFVVAAFISMQLFANELPLWNGCKVVGVELWMSAVDGRWRVNLVAIDKHGRRTGGLIFPKFEMFFNDSAYEYYLDHVADIPVLDKQKLSSVDGEDLRQRFIQRRREAIIKRENARKEREEKLAKASTLYPKLLALFGYKIGEVFDVSKGDHLRKSSPDNVDVNLYWFTPDKQFLSFDKYSVGITPVTHRIYSIEASAPYSKATLELAKDALEKKFSTTFEYKKDKNRYLIHGCSRNKKYGRILILQREGDRLTVSLFDTLGIDIMEKEAKQVKDKLSSAAVDAL